MVAWRRVGAMVVVSIWRSLLLYDALREVPVNIVIDGKGSSLTMHGDQKIVDAIRAQANKARIKASGAIWGSDLAGETSPTTPATPKSGGGSSDCPCWPCDDSDNPRYAPRSWDVTVSQISSPEFDYLTVSRVFRYELAH